MSTMIGNRKKPWRGYGGYNTLQACRLHVNQAAVIDPAEAKGTAEQIVLQLNKNFHFGTIPAGAIILPPTIHVITAFTATATVEVGPEDDTDGILTAAGSVVTTAGLKVNVTGGVMLGYTNRDILLHARLAVAAASVGAFDLIIPFYVHAD